MKLKKKGIKTKKKYQIKLLLILTNLPPTICTTKCNVNDFLLFDDSHIDISRDDTSFNILVG